MFVIIEGLHDTGKSTLANSFKHFDLFASKRLFPEFANARIANISDFALGNNCSIAWFAQFMSRDYNILFDRLHLSEYAYSQAFNRITKDKAMRRFEMIDDKLSRYKVALIYLYCDYKYLLARKKDKNNVYSQDDYDELTSHFNRIFLKTKIKSISIDSGSHSIKDVIDISRKFLNDKFNFKVLL